MSDIDRKRPNLGLIIRNKNREDDLSFGSLVNSHRSIGTLPWTPTSKVQIRLQKVRELLKNDHNMTESTKNFKIKFLVRNIFFANLANEHTKHK